jgi:aminoglycoside phosphotransferase (APT) family kinase protein
LPLEREEIDRLRAFAPRFADLCDELVAHDVPETVQHDDLHMANVYAQGGQLRVLDWGDSSISHPFASLVVTFRFLEEVNKLPPQRTRGSRGSATPIWNRGVGGSKACSRSRCVSALSRTRSHGCGSATASRRRNAPSSTGRSRLCCGERSLRRSSRRGGDADGS